MNGTGGEAPRVLTHFMAVGRLRPNRHRPPLVVDGHEDDLGLGHLDPLAASGCAALRVGGTPHRSASTSTRTVTDVRPTRTSFA